VPKHEYDEVAWVPYARIEDFVHNKFKETMNADEFAILLAAIAAQQEDYNERGNQ
jgi:hypothetical protein